MERSNKMHQKRAIQKQMTKRQEIKEKERMLNAARVNQLVTYKDTIQRLSADFLTEADWNGIGIFRYIYK